MYPIAIKTVCAIAALSLTAGVSAAAIETTSASSSTENHVLSADQVILFGSEGRIEVVPRTDKLMHTGSVVLASTEPQMSNSTGNIEVSIGNTINKRCQSHNVFMVNEVKRYITPDVAMSGVIRAPPDTSATVNVGSGFWVGNSLSVSTPQAFDIVKDFLSSTLGFSYGKSWTSTYSTGYSFTVPAGKYGAVVSNPMAIRQSGYMDQGCIGSSKRVEFSAETFKSKTYSKMTWVDGIISVCVGDTYPLPRCYGNGTL